jgi:methionyl-tRNA formyltransferase
MRVVFVGCVEFSKLLLQEVLKSPLEVVGVVTKEKSKINADFCDLKEVVINTDIDSFYFNSKTSDDLLVTWVSNRRPDIIFCFGWSHLLPSNLINLPRLGIIGYHPTELPKNRGRHPIIWALVLGLRETASSFFMIEEGADTGDIVSQLKVEILELDDANSLYKKLNVVAIKQIEILCQELSKGELKKTPQDHSQANMWRKRNELDGKLDWKMSSRAIYNLIRGLTRPYPGAYFEFLSEKISIFKSRIVLENVWGSNIEPGKILQVSPSEIQVKTIDGIIAISDLSKMCNLTVGEYL